jgi:phosphoribosylformimino-5-aminoimidazole carboxamide ribotide isomerase
MELIPALDLLDGTVVRLHQGDYAKVTRYDVDPIAHARSLRGRVARLHVVDLEGAKSGKPTQHDTIAKMCDAFGEGVQIGGGIRSAAQVDALVERGVSRVVLGTAAVRDPALVQAIAEKHPGRVILAVDAKDGKVAIDGWTVASELTALDVARRFEGLDLDSLLFTDVSRDGTRGGPAVESTATLSKESGRRVIASGGVGVVEHLRALAATGAIFGVVVGRALLDRVFDLDAAIEASRGP